MTTNDVHEHRASFHAPSEEPGAVPLRRTTLRKQPTAATRVDALEAQLREARERLRSEHELAVLRQVAAERIGGDWAGKPRKKIFTALIRHYGFS